MVHVRSSIEVARPADEVFAFIADASNNPTWQEGMRSCTWTTDGPIAVGSVYEQHAAFLGRPIVSTFEVVAFEPGASLTIRTIESTFPIQVTRTVQPLAEDRCLVSADVRGEPGGLLALLGPLTTVMVRRSVREDYKRLAVVLDGQAAQP